MRHKANPLQGVASPSQSVTTHCATCQSSIVIPRGVDQFHTQCVSCIVSSDPGHFLEPYSTQSCPGCLLFPRQTYGDRRNRAACYQATGKWSTREGVREWEALGRPRGNPENQFGHGMPLVTDECASDSQDESNPDMVEIEVDYPESDYSDDPPSPTNRSMLQGTEPSRPPPGQLAIEGFNTGQREMDVDQPVVIYNAPPLTSTQEGAGFARLPASMTANRGGESEQTQMLAQSPQLPPLPPRAEGKVPVDQQPRLADIVLSSSSGAGGQARLTRVNHRDKFIRPDPPPEWVGTRSVVPYEPVTACFTA